jgi:amino acid transporter
MAIYILVSLVAVGNLLPDEISRYKEYALAVAAKPFLGKFGFVLIGLGALLSTASAINATLFGTARLGMVMAQESELPQAFSHKERTKDIPYVSLLLITVLSLLFVNTTDLKIISSFASSIFLLIFAAINLSAFRLRKRIGINGVIPLAGLLFSLASWILLSVYLYRTEFMVLVWITVLYLSVIAAEFCFSERRLFLKR